MPNMEDYYETNSVGAGRASYSCEFCSGNIAKGQPSDVHKFYPEFTGYRTHKKCSKAFLESEQCPGCCENYDPKKMKRWEDTLSYCEECYKEVEAEGHSSVAEAVAAIKKEVKKK